MADRLTRDDVDRLLADSSAESRIETAAKLARQLDADLGEAERRLAEDIFRLMARDAELRVREALAEHLKESSNVPHDVALALARDVDSVALPMLAASDVFTDADLVEIVRSAGVSKQVAVAGRRSVSGAVAEALVDSGQEQVVVALVGNAGAEIPESSLRQVVEEFGDSEEVQGRLVAREGLPITVVERLVTRVSENLFQQIVQRHTLPDGMAADIVLKARERAVVGLSGGADEAAVAELVRHLHTHGRLTHSIILRALCMGDLAFFEAAVAERAETTLVNARVLIHDGGPLGLKAAHEKAGLPRNSLPAVRAAIDVMREMAFDGEPGDRERYSRRLIERILTQYGDLGVNFEANDLEYLLDRMDHLPLGTGG